MKTLELIVDILFRQIDGYEALYELLGREREYLVSYDIEGFQSTAKQKDSLVMQLRLLEEERARLTEKFFTERGVFGERTITRLWELSGDSRFMTAKYRLQALLKGIEELNQFNRILIDRTMNYLNASSSFLNTVRPGGAELVQGMFSKEV